MSLDHLLHGVLLALIAALLFFAAFAVHVLIWRLSTARPSGMVLILVMTAAVVLPCALAAIAAASSLINASAPDIVVASGLALELAACYVISYPALQADSPSLQIARRLAAAGAAGIARADLYARLSEASLVGDRLDDLLRDGLAEEADDRIRCTRRGAMLARLFASWKALLREEKGG